MTIKNDHQVVVPFFNPEKSIFYIDIYDLDLNLLARYKILTPIADLKKGEYVIQAMVDNENNFYVMVICRQDFPKLLKYKLIFE